MNNGVYLLEVNVLIALATPDHTAHARAQAWFATGPQFATCPITQGALVRFHVRWAIGPSMAKAKTILTRIAALAKHEFWPDDIEFRQVADTGIAGHKQVTDAYLVALAKAHGGRLATMDEALAALHASAALI